MTRAVALAALAAGLAPFAVAALVAARPHGRPHRGGLLAALARVGRRLGGPNAPAGLRARLAAAGAEGRFGVADVMAAKAGAAAVALLVVVGPASALPGRMGAAALLTAPVLAFVAPDLWLRRRAARRARRMDAEMADALDLLRVAVEAGLTPVRALGEVGRRHRGLLGAELRATAVRIAFGVPRDEALSELERRAPAAGVPALVVALRRIERHGVPLAPVLAALAADARAQRDRRIRERAAKAAPKIQLVIALLLVPAVMLLVAAALGGALVR